MDKYTTANRASWDERAGLHAADATGFYGIDALLAGADLLQPVEAGEIGDIAGLKLAHFQCHIGTDTLSLARRGARVTGLDFSPRAVAEARALAARAGIEARFVEGSVYDAPALLGGGFDMVFTSWGTTGWLDDIGRWARAIAGVLRPGGRFYFADTHPFALVLDEIEGRIVPRFGWRTPRHDPIGLESPTSYTGDAMTNTMSYEWLHPLSDILGALFDAGMRLDFLHEHELLPFRLFPSMVPLEGTRAFRLPDGAVRLPLAISLLATKGE